VVIYPILANTLYPVGRYGVVADVEITAPTVDRVTGSPTKNTVYTVLAAMDPVSKPFKPLVALEIVMVAAFVT
jgi:hypothetical protein